MISTRESLGVVKGSDYLLASGGMARTKDEHDDEAFHEAIFHLARMPDWHIL